MNWKITNARAVYYTREYIRVREYKGYNTEQNKFLELKMCEGKPSQREETRNEGIKCVALRATLINFAVLVGRRICIWESELLPEIFRSLALDENERGVATDEG